MIWLRIVFGNLDVAILGLELKGRFSCRRVNRQVEFTLVRDVVAPVPRNRQGSYRWLCKISDEMLYVSWNVLNKVPSEWWHGSRTPRPPTIRGDREIAGLESEVEIAETIVREQPAAATNPARAFPFASHRAPRPWRSFQL